MTRAALILLCLTYSTSWGDELNLEQQKALQEFVHQDCGSCHGMSLQGGLGPAITKEALAHINVATIGSIIRIGRPGTPMPPWEPVLNKIQIDWIAQYLKDGKLPQ